MSTTQYGQAIELLIREFVIAYPTLGLVHILKTDVSDGFYRIGLHPTDSPKLGIFFPSEGEDNELLAFPLTITIGRKDSSPIFGTATEKVTYLVNAAMH